MLNGFCIGWEWRVWKWRAEYTEIDFQPTFVFEKKKDFTMPRYMWKYMFLGLPLSKGIKSGKCVISLHQPVIMSVINSN
jgi:hypothetical protein